MARVQSYKELILWQKSMLAVNQVYSVVKKLPKEELYGLTLQIRRSAVSIPSNIAEGQTRNHTNEFIQFLSIANGSRAELETQLILCIQLGYLHEEEIKEILDSLAEIGKMIHKLIFRLSNKNV